MKVTEQVAAFAEPVVREHGCSLWDVEYVREGSEYFLRLYIDKEGGVDILDCEAVSRKVSDLLKILPAATRSSRFIRHRRRSIRSPPSGRGQNFKRPP